jgi:hypothetical protein
MMIRMRILAAVALIAASASADTSQEQVHSMSHEVMPFDMLKTDHVLNMTVEGGIQNVQTRDVK